MFRRSKLLVTAVLASFLLTIWTKTALANTFNWGQGKRFVAPQGYGQEYKGKGVMQKRFQKKIQLRDIENHWAQEAMVAMYMAGMVRGYPDLSFRPEASVKKEEAVAMLIRMLGLEQEKAKTRPAREVFGEFPAWAQNSLALAVERGVITPAELAGWRANEPASRYEVATWLVRAAGLQPETSMTLPFLDAFGIPWQYRAYVAAAYQNQLMVGYPGNVFRPNQPVKRAEMAALMLRLLAQCPLHPVYRAVQGIVKDVDDASITIQLFPYRLYPPFGHWPDLWKQPVTRTFNFSEDVVAFVDGEPADPAEVPLEARVILILNAKSESEVLVILSSSGPASRPGERVPQVIKLVPANKATGVDPETTSLQVVFNEPVEPVDDLDAVKDEIEIENVTDDEDVKIKTVSLHSNVLTATLATYLEDNKTYQVTVENGVLQDRDGNKFPGIAVGEWVFSTGDTLAPAIRKLTPVHGEDDVPPGTRTLQVEFTEDIRAVDDLDEVAAGIKVKNTTDSEVVALAEDDPVSINGDTLRIRLKYGLEARKSYQVTVGGGLLEDEAGNEFDGIGAERWTFSTGE
ncbi:MAG: Ig-like domain-containing protein [Bacillota bacterium]